MVVSQSAPSPAHWIVAGGALGWGVAADAVLGRAPALDASRYALARF